MAEFRSRKGESAGQAKGTIDVQVLLRGSAESLTGCAIDVNASQLSATVLFLTFVVTYVTNGQASAQVAGTDADLARELAERARAEGLQSGRGYRC